MPIILHGLALSPPCRAVLLTAKVLGVDIELKDVDMFVKQEHKTESYLKMNPCHTIPTMDDDGYYLWESRAILGYLVQQYGKDDKLYPKDPKKRGMVDNMLYFDGTSLYPSFAEYFYPPVFAGKPEDPDRKAVVEERLSILDKWLEQHPYVAGDELTIADFSVINSLSTPKAAGFSFEPYPNLIKWCEKLKEEVPLLVEVTKPGVDQLTALFQEKKK